MVFMNQVCYSECAWIYLTKHFHERREEQNGHMIENDPHNKNGDCMHSIKPCVYFELFERQPNRRPQKRIMLKAMGRRVSSLPLAYLTSVHCHVV